MPVAILTGVTGFIGKHLLSKLLEQGWHVCVITRVGSLLPASQEGLTVYEHNGTMASMMDIFEQTKPTHVFHLASKFLARHTTADIESLVSSNLSFGLQLAEAAAAHRCQRFINTGTAWQHFENRKYDPVCLYAATKQAFEDLLEFYSQTTPLEIVTLKLHDTYGPDDPRGKLISLLLDASRTQAPLDLSPGEQQINLVHIQDVLTAFLLAATIPLDLHRHQKFEVRAATSLTIRELAAQIQSATGHPITANWGHRPYREREVMSPAHQDPLLPGWNPCVQLEEGIRQLWGQG
jgi:nucleoside-diphosphate-sugar epimerase